MDLVLVVILLFPAFFLLLFRRIGAEKLPITREMLKRIGVFPIRNHYYEPSFNSITYDKNMSITRSLPGLDFRIEEQLELLSKLQYSNEFRRYVLSEEQKHSEGFDSFSLNNDSFKAGDAEFLYQITRYIKPRKVVEVGSGNSTKIVARALEENCKKGRGDSVHICIEPFERHWLDNRNDIILLRQKVEETDFNWSKELTAGDLLFIDSSHIIRPRNDVLYLYQYVIPLLPSGVIVHVHDIFTPRDYPQQWLNENVLFWNEQYLLETLLANNNRYKILASLNLLKHSNFNELHKVCPYMTYASEPGSLYFVVL